MGDGNRLGGLARSLKAIRSINWGDGGGYVVPSIEYVNPNGPPPGDLFADPVKTARLLELARQSILLRPCLCGKPTCGNVGCPRDERTYLPAADCDCWADPDEGLNGFPSWAQLHPLRPTVSERICLLNPKDSHA